MKRFSIILLPLALVIISLVMWFGFPARIVKRLSSNMEAGDPAAFILYYGLLTAVVLGVWKFFELTL